jgi:hypothetical protein
MHLYLLELFPNGPTKPWFKLSWTDTPDAALAQVRIWAADARVIASWSCTLEQKPVAMTIIGAGCKTPIVHVYECHDVEAMIRAGEEFFHRPATRYGEGNRKDVIEAAAPIEPIATAAPISAPRSMRSGRKKSSGKGAAEPKAPKKSRARKSAAAL